MSELTISQARVRWYQGIDRYCWVVLVVAALGWMFDTMDQNLFNLVRAGRSRPMALGLFQSLSAVGNMLAAVVTLALAGLSWRWAYAVGAAPALLVLWIRSVVKEPDKWVEAKAHATAGREMGKIGAL